MLCGLVWYGDGHRVGVVVVVVFVFATVCVLLKMFAHIAARCNGVVVLLVSCGEDVEISWSGQQILWEAQKCGGCDCSKLVF